MVEKQFSESLLNNLPGIFYLISRAGKILRWNAKFEAVTDRPAEEMAQISPIDLFEGEDKPAIASAIERVFTHGQVQVEGQLVSKAGQSMPYQFSGEKIMVDGAPCLLGIGVDVSKLKQSELKLIESEEKLGLALNGADAGLWSWNVKTGEDVLDERWCGILGYRQAEVTQEISSWENMMHPDDKERIMDVVYKHLEDETNEYNHEYRLKCKNGDWKWVQALGKIVERDINGEPVRMAGIILDIAERKETEAELEQHKQQLEHLVLERTRELEIKNADLDKAMKVFVGREIKIIELEKRIKALQSK